MVCNDDFKKDFLDSILTTNESNILYVHEIFAEMM